MSYKVTLSNRKTVKRWGTACPDKTKILMYRHSVWIFLHELSHLISPPVRVGNKWDIHGQHFGSTLTKLYQIWLEG